MSHPSRVSTICNKGLRFRVSSYHLVARANLDLGRTRLSGDAPFPIDIGPVLPGPRAPESSPMKRTSILSSIASLGLISAACTVTTTSGDSESGDTTTDSGTTGNDDGNATTSGDGDGDGDPSTSTSGDGDGDGDNSCASTDECAGEFCWAPFKATPPPHPISPAAPSASPPTISPPRTPHWTPRRTFGALMTRPAVTSLRA